MGYADLSCYGNKINATPNIDRLASQGLKFTQAYAGGPLCTPTRASFMTGRYPAKIPVGLKEPLTLSAKDSTYGLSAEVPSVATLMKEGGYETVLIGKWHLGCLPKHSPVKNGFNYFYGFLNGAADYISHKDDGRKPQFYENTQPMVEQGYLTDLFTRKAISFLKGEHDKPFFLTLNYNAPHWPWQGPGDKVYADTTNFRSGGSLAIYASMMKSLDDGIGAVLKALDETGLSEETIVIFTNDNGGERYSNNGGLAKSKATLWEGGIRVPAIIRWPGKIPSGGSSEQPIITMDWTATILAAAGVKSHPEFPLDGIDLLPLCRSQGKEIPRTFYWRTFQRSKQKAIRAGNWKYLQDADAEYLFNLIQDPGEKINLKARNQGKLQELKTMYSNWEKTVLRPIPL